jgi:hypothetical protein
VAGISWTEDLRSWHEACERAVAPVNHRPLALPDADACQLCSLPLELFAGSTTATAYALRPYVVDARNGAGPRLVTTGALDRYSCSWGLRPIRYLKRDYTTPRWPASVDVPAEIAQARDRQQGVKILIGGLTTVIEAWLDDGGASAGTVSTWVIRPQGTMALETVFGLLAVLNSATFSRLYVERHGAKAMSGKQITIQKRALLEMPVPAPLLARNRARSPAVTCDLGETGTQLAICQRVGRLLQSVSPQCGQGLQNVSPDSGPRQNVSPDSALWPRLDKLGHLAAGLLYGQSPDASLDDYDWWCDRSGLRPDPTPMRDLVALLYAASAERALSISDQA